MNFLGYAFTTVTIGVAAVFLVSPVLHQLPSMYAITIHENVVGIRLDQNYRVTPVDIKTIHVVPFQYEVISQVL